MPEEKIIAQDAVDIIDLNDIKFSVQLTQTKEVTDTVYEGTINDLITDIDNYTRQIAHLQSLIEEKQALKAKLEDAAQKLP